MEKYFEVVKGEDKAIEIDVKDSETGDPIDLTGKTVSGVVETCPENLAVVTGSFEVTNAVLGKVTMTLTDTQTALLEAGVRSFEVVLDEGTDRKIVQFKNVLEVKDRI